MILKETDNLSVEGMLPYLSGQGISAGIEIHDCLASTNVTAKDMALSGARHGTVVIANSQTAGKGRYGRSFFSPPGHGIYMSFIFQKIPPGRGGAPTLITAYAAVSVCEAIEAATGKTPQIKWVNDIFLDGKKICGILCEGISHGERASHGAATLHGAGTTQYESVAESNGGDTQGQETFQGIIVGIGVNFSTPKTGYPKEIVETAGSIFGENKPTITRNRLTAEIINRMFDIINNHDRAATLAEYKKRLMMLGEKVLVTGMRESFEATAIDIDDTGRLIIKNKNGEIQTLTSGEIRGL